ncbi:hypothetical protein [Mycobacterium asiaticum]|uniref:hypothetical protein n=1 Tax=Mycobacterium asiaticum TaxID=1790 RepID=UPI0007EF3FE7|nr:hypothetical protein [Mycobacterium asiaticum]OBJ53722.1 hypothetical protein A9W94_22700 [Mycobacterium asiaticum]
MGTFNQRLLVAALCIISAALAAALLLGEPHGSIALASRDLQRNDWPYIRHALSRKNIGTSIQAAGALITFYGLGRAYLRTNSNQTPMQWLRDIAKKAWDKLSGNKPSPRAHHGSAHATIGWHATVSLEAMHKVDITLSLQEQIKRLATFVNNRSREATQTETRVAAIERELGKIRDDARLLEQNMWTQIDSQIKELNSRLDRVQTLDLTWAILGLFISFAGTLWSFGT